MGAAPVSDRSRMATWWAKCSSAPARLGLSKFIRKHTTRYHARMQLAPLPTRLLADDPDTLQALMKDRDRTRLSLDGSATPLLRR
jgi:hypothetical protein